MVMVVSERGTLGEKEKFLKKRKFPEKKNLGWEEKTQKIL